MQQALTMSGPNDANTHTSNLQTVSTYNKCSSGYAICNLMWAKLTVETRQQQIESTVTSELQQLVHRDQHKNVQNNGQNNSFKRKSLCVT